MIQPIHLSTLNVPRRFHRSVVIQYTDYTADLIKSRDLVPYFVTTTFYDVDHEPSDAERQLRHEFNQTRLALNQLPDDAPISRRMNLETVYSEQYQCLRQLVHHMKTHRAAARPYQSSLAYGKVESIWRRYDRLIAHMLPSLINNHNRPSKLQFHPITIDFIDAAGSRHHRSVACESGSLHIHSLYLVDPSICPAFERLADRRFADILWHADLNEIRDVHVQSVSKTFDAIEQVIGYSSKYLSTPEGFYLNRDVPLIYQYPITDRERRQRCS